MSAPDPRRLARPKSALWAVVGLWIVALHASLWWISYHPEPRGLTGDEIMYWRGASQLAAGLEWHPEPLWPPFYATFLGWISAATGGSRVWVAVVQSVMLFGVALLVRDLCRRLTGSQVAAAVAGVWVVAYPPLVAFVHYLWPEVFHMLLLLGALAIFVRCPDRPLWLAAGGASLGLALSSKGILGLFFPVLLWPLARAGTPRQRLGRPAVVLAAMALVIAPTACSNHVRSTGVVISSSGAFNLWVGLNNRARKSFVDKVVDAEWRAYKASAPTFRERREILERKIAGLVRERGVPALVWGQLGRQYFRLLDKDSLLTEQLPGGALCNPRRGYRRPPGWLAMGLRASSYGLYAVLLVSAVVGLAVRPPRGQRWLWVGLAFLGYNLAILLLLHVKSRYRIQMLPFLFLYSGCAVAWAGARLGWSPGEARLWDGSGGRRGPWLALAVSLAVALVLFLAFGGPLID